MERVKGYCIDSDILIDYLRGFEEARFFLLKVNNEHALYISIISIVEIYSGKDTIDLKKQIEIDQFLDNFEIIALTPAIAKQAGELRRDYQKPFADMMVAASALNYGLLLITKNTKHFQSIENLEVVCPY